MGKILAADFKHGRKSYYSFHFQKGENYRDYFDEKGNTLRKAFLKAPLNFFRISSRYSKRRFHPVLKRNKAHFEVTALDTVQDPNIIGNNFAKLWAFSKTHYKPFLDKDRTKYNRVGFGFAKAKRGTNRYYACAIFGKKK